MKMYYFGMIAGNCFIRCQSFYYKFGYMHNYKITLQYDLHEKKVKT